MRVVVVVVLLLVVGLLTACSRLGLSDTDADLSQPGPYGVGLARQVVTYTRADGQPRDVETLIWYPSATKDQSSDRLGAVRAELGLPAQAEPGLPIAEGGPFPLIIFSHGYQASPFVYSNLLTHLASHGFVVAGPEHRDCPSQCTPQDRRTEVENRPADVSAVLDSLLALNDGDDPRFGHRLDPARVGMAGQSFGGWTTLTVLERDRRFRAGLAMAPATTIQPSPDPVGVSRPVMLTAGVLDTMVPYALTTRFFSEIPRSAPDHYLLAVQQVGHQFTDRCFPSLVTTSCEASMPQPQLQQLVNRVGTAFLLRYVAGRTVTDDRIGLHDETDAYVMLKGSADALAAVPTPWPLQQPAHPDVPPGTTLLQDDLSVARGDHLPTSSPDPQRFTAGYADGAYQIAVSQPAAQGEAIVAGTYADASIAVDATLVDPTPDQYIQLACRSQNANAQYRFTVRPTTGEYRMTRWFTIPRFSSQASMLPFGLISSAVHQGGATNHVEFDCHGTTLTGRINGVTVASVQDNTYASGQMWIAVGETAGGPGTGSKPAARFSNLVVTQQ